MKTMKKFISVLLVAVLVISTMATTGFAWTGNGTQQIKYSLTADKEFVSAGDTVTFTFTMETSEDATWTTFGNFLYSFMYNDKVLTPVSYEWGPIIAEFSAERAIGIVTAATTLTNNVYNKSTADEKAKYTADGINAMARFQCVKDANTTYGSQGYWELQPGESTVLFTITCEVAAGVSDNTPVSFDYYSGLGTSKYFYVQTIDTANNNKGTNQTTMTNYDVSDVTISDKAVVGEDPCANGHTSTTATEEVITAETCTEAGLKKVTYTCDVCGKVDRTEDVVIPASHKYVAEVTAPTCTAEGYTTYTCSVCGDNYTADEEAALGHTAAEAVVENEVAATCKVDGSYDLVVYCSVCDEELSRNTEVVKATDEHVYAEVVDEKAATCTEDGYVTKACGCGETETTVVPATGHDYDAVVTAPTCTAEGYTTYTCACGDSYVADKVAATGHTYTSEETTAPTCTEAGVMTYTCACGDTYTEDIPAVGHNMEAGETVAPTCTEAGYTVYTCANDCGTTENRDEVTATGHDYDTVVTAPTCTEAGYTTYTCACGDTYTADEVAAAGHAYEVSFVKNATCSGDGYTRYTCSACDDKYEEPIASKNHTKEDGSSAIVTIPAVAPTCKNHGYTEGSKCELCNTTVVVQQRVDALGHTAGDAVEENVVEPTCTEAGSKDVVTYCTTCEEELSREAVTMDALGHADADEDGRCDECDARLDESGECNHACHKKGIRGFFWKIVKFFCRLFNIQQYCDCGEIHYEKPIFNFKR